MRILLFLSTIGLILISCKNAPKEQKTPAVADEPGKMVYNRYCYSCHQTDGSGVPGLYPPIRNSDFVVSEKEKLIRIMLVGLKGEVEVKGEVYDNEMPAHNYLSDKEIADVLTYIRSNLGNNAPEITPEKVRSLRASLQQQ